MVAEARSLARYVPFVLVGVVAVVLSVSVPFFLTSRNLINVLTQSSALGLMAIGLSAVLILGGIDLSIPAVMALAAIVGAMYMRAGGIPLTAAFIMLAVGVSAGCVNGFAVAKLKMIPFIVTFSMQAVATGTSIWITNATSVQGLPDSFADVILAKVWIVPVPVIALIALTLVVEILLRRSIFGRWLYSVGTSLRASRVSGLATDRVLFGSYAFSGLFAGIAAIILTARLGSAAVTMGSDNAVLDVISSAVVGGVSIYGGSGSMLGAVIGALIITLISNSMNLLQVPYYLTLVIKGVVIITFVAIDSLRKR
jgi:ribose/xylose/arabinose/galactoside ABC-type transport system permease subunit